MRKRLLSASEQVADRLRDELVRGRWAGTLPGIHTLATDLGFPRKAVEGPLLLNSASTQPDTRVPRRRLA